MKNNISNLDNKIYYIQDQEFAARQRIAGKVVSDGFKMILSLIDSGIVNCLEIDKKLEEFIKDNNCYPTFKDFHGFPNATCISVNKELVHGIPKNYFLKEGDVVSFDFGATYKEAVADAARTFIIGEPKMRQHAWLIKTTKECLEKAIQSIKIGEKFGSIGFSISKHAKNNGFSVVEDFGGHGIGLNEHGKASPHHPPFIPNKSSNDYGLRIYPGMSIAIEPLLVLGNSNKHYTDRDGWTIMAENICAHEENTIFIHEDRVEVMTA